MKLLLLFLYTTLVYVSSLRKTVNQLSFSGGGAFGATEIGILKNIVANDPTKKYDILTGVSAGALNAGFLSYFSDIVVGTKTAEQIYTHLSSRDVYTLYPPTGISVYNTEPLQHTLNAVIDKMSSDPVIHTLIGTVNLNTGFFDIYSYEKMQTREMQVKLLMSSSAIPLLFPPIQLNNYLYVDGGTLSNEILQVEHNTQVYTNITYITPSQTQSFNSSEPLTSLESIVKREFKIVTQNYNDPFVDLYTNCTTPIGEIHHYFVPDMYLQEYSMLDFNHGKELIDIGFQYAKYIKYKLC